MSVLLGRTSLHGFGSSAFSRMGHYLIEVEPAKLAKFL